MMKKMGLQKQQGVALIVSLVILLIMTVLGMQGIRSTTLEERMSRNYRDNQMSFQAAEAALRDAEALIEATPLNLANYSSTCVNGLCFNDTAGACPAVNPATPHWLNAAGIWDNSANHRVYSGTINGVFQQPRYIIEFRCYVQTNPSDPVPLSTPGSGAEWSEIYRITALGFGGSASSRTMLQSTYKKPL